MCSILRKSIAGTLAWLERQMIPALDTELILNLKDERQARGARWRHKRRRHRAVAWTGPCRQILDYKGKRPEGGEMPTEEGPDGQRLFPE